MLERLVAALHARRIRKSLTRALSNQIALFVVRLKNFDRISARVVNHGVHSRRSPTHWDPQNAPGLYQVSDDCVDIVHREHGTIPAA